MPAKCSQVKFYLGQCPSHVVEGNPAPSCKCSRVQKTLSHVHPNISYFIADHKVIFSCSSSILINHTKHVVTITTSGAHWEDRFGSPCCVKGFHPAFVHLPSLPIKFWSILDRLISEKVSYLFTNPAKLDYLESKILIHGLKFLEL